MRARRFKNVLRSIGVLPSYTPSDDRKLSDFPSLDGKTVAIVGNAASLLGTDFGREIENHDIVLRMNRGLPIKHEAQGQRTDILAIATNEAMRGVVRRSGAEYLWWMAPRGRAAGGAEFYFYDLDRWEALRDTLGAAPSVGAMVLDAVSVLAPRRVTVYGFDFKATRSFYQQDQYVGPHHYAAESERCAQLIAEKGWRFRSA